MLLFEENKKTKNSEINQKQIEWWVSERVSDECEVK